MFKERVLETMLYIFLAKLSQKISMWAKIFSDSMLFFYFLSICLIFLGQLYLPIEALFVIQIFIRKND